MNAIGDVLFTRELLILILMYRFYMFIFEWKSCVRKKQMNYIKKKDALYIKIYYIYMYMYIIHKDIYSIKITKKM